MGGISHVLGILGGSDSGDDLYTSCMEALGPMGAQVVTAG